MQKASSFADKRNCDVGQHIVQPAREAESLDRQIYTLEPIAKAASHLRKSLSEVPFEAVNGRSFELIRVVELLCEICEKPFDSKEKPVSKFLISSNEDFQNLLNRATVHDRAEIDVESGKIYFYDHDFPGEVHVECIEKLDEKK
ncbi:hypothetical protein MUO56_03725 [Candidatus Bathyarchaeota archaeon]|nr:hypothetical protein [Candidatus Bathyarchaeota archaeon]